MQDAASGSDVKRKTGYDVRRVPIERLPTIELTRALARRNPMYGLLEVDVTTARDRIRQHRERTGERLSFTAFLVGCLAQAVDETREVQAFRRGRKLVVFDRVEVATLVEVTADGTTFPLPYVVRDAAHKSVETISDELRAAQSRQELLARVRRQLRVLRWMPAPIRWLVWRVVAPSPGLRRHFGGTVAVTSVGMFGAGPMWGIANVAYPVTLIVGGTGRRPVERDGAIEQREHLCLTLALDHEVVDGAPAARFGARLRALIEAGDGLPRAGMSEGVQASTWS